MNIGEGPRVGPEILTCNQAQKEGTKRSTPLQRACAVQETRVTLLALSYPLVCLPRTTHATRVNESSTIGIGPSKRQQPLNKKYVHANNRAACLPAKLSAVHAHHRLRIASRTGLRFWSSHLERCTSRAFAQPKARFLPRPCPPIPEGQSMVSPRTHQASRIGPSDTRMIELFSLDGWRALCARIFASGLRQIAMVWIA